MAVPIPSGRRNETVSGVCSCKAGSFGWPPPPPSVSATGPVLGSLPRVALTPFFVASKRKSQGYTSTPTEQSEGPQDECRLNTN